jgi:hypothetical protein
MSKPGSPLKMDANFNQPITITVLLRLLGHGGFANNEISVSYLIEIMPQIHGLWLCTMKWST